MFHLTRGRSTAWVMRVAAVTAIVGPLVFLLSNPAQADAPRPTRAVALEGQTAPGTGGKKFDPVSPPASGFDEPMMNSRGDVAFNATYGNGAGSGVFLWRNHALTAVARKGQKTKEGTFSGTTNNDYDGPAINSEGTVAFVARNITGGTTTICGSLPGGCAALYQKKVGQPLTAIAKQGGAVPGGGHFITFDDISQNDYGAVAFIAVYDDEGLKNGVFLKPTSGPLRAIVRNGAELPDTGGGTLCFSESDTVSIEGPWLNEEGVVAFQPDCISGGKGGLEGSVFVKEPEDAIEPLVLIGDPGPESIGGTIGGVKIGRPGLNEKEAAVLLSINEGSVENVLATKELSDEGGFDVCAKQDDPAPDSTGKISFNGAPAISEHGVMSMPATVGTQDNIHAIYTCHAGKVTAIAFQGDTKPAGSGKVYGSLEEASLAGEHVVFLDETNNPTGVFIGGND